MVLLVALVGGCRLPENALDGPLAVPLRITATPDSIEVDAPAWYAPQTVVYLCSAEPPSLPEPGPNRVGWTPGASCHDYGRFAAPDGLSVSLPLAALSEAEQPAFDAAVDWYLLLVKVEGERIVAAIRTRLSPPGRAT